MYQYFGTVLRIVDGDTFWATLDLGFRLRLDVDIRLANINAPEVANWTPGGLSNAAINYLNQTIPPGAAFVVDVSRPEKYGRYLGTVRYLKGSTDKTEILRLGSVLNDEMIRLGFAAAYKGGKK